jgi:hypothetical protein
MTVAERTDLERRSGLLRILEEVRRYDQAVAADEIVKREYDFRFSPAAANEDELHEWQQRVDMDLEHDLDQLDRRSDREEKGFLRHIAKLDETIRDEERKEFERQDDLYAHLKGEPSEWAKHKQAQEFEAQRRQELRGIYYIGAIHDFVQAQTERHEERLQAVHAQNDNNVRRLDEAFDRAVRGLENVLEALGGLSPEAEAHGSGWKPRPSAKDVSRDEFQELVLAAHDSEREP